MTTLSILRVVFLCGLVLCVVWLVYLGWVTRDDA
jgi:hypothetical protein